jgi:hypothetical protein
MPVYGLLADTVAAAHLAAVALMLTGGVLALRRPRLLWAHLPVALGILAVNRAGADCPLTDLELALRHRAGEAGYGEEGFIGHYLVEPLHPGGITPSVQVVIYALAVLPNAVAYALLARRALRRSRRPVAQPIAIRGFAAGSSQRSSSTMADSGTDTQPCVGPEPLTWRKIAAPR